MAIMEAWADETDGVHEAFRSLFPSTTEGYMKFLFALHYMAMAECCQRKISPEAFLQIVPAIVGHWFNAGKPEGVELLCITGFDMETLKERLAEAMRDKPLDMGEKPSSDA
jgi:hypothetical protein